ncbi:cysteine desulfurase NifS [Formosa sp. Hel1_33_131]|jgi:cysteine desulfurase|uniref:cysteine desulfurase family protein n=1 Tax=Formosa sp. Hel1_33_131 TaxID=1336794 RepID=UPI00084E1684|nr:cysteine desulfurase family protein [Formosa sp. Hel1_33_131]AOR29583.1 cysteine desulfurase NifS [Formosa sp. Hel1_33_131]
MNSIYLDNAATTQVRDEVIDTMADVLKSNYGNASSTHGYGRSSKSIIESCRKRIASHFNALASEIVFTSGGTEADNLVLKSAVKDLKVTHIITSKIEHHAVLHTVEQLEKDYKIKVNYVAILADGTIDYNHLETLLESTDKTLVSLMHVNNEIGTILDLQRVADLCKSRDALFHSDSVQSVGHYHLDLQAIPIDFLAASAHKFHGPKGIGFVFIRKNSGLKPLIHGGMQERGVRAGTESIHDIVGLDTSLALAYENLESEMAQVKSLKSYFVEQLKTQIEGVKFNGCCSDSENSTYTLVNVCLPVSEANAPMFLFQLDLKGIACSKGSACQSGSAKGSHVLTQILSEDDLKKPSIRFSFSIYNSKEEIDAVVETLQTLINTTAS